MIRDAPGNREKLRDLEQRLGSRAIEISPLAKAFRITTPQAHLDIIFDQIVGGLDFNGLRSRGSEIVLGEVVAVVASLEDVIASKEAAGRPKDLGQLPILRDTLKVLRAVKALP